MLTHFGNVPIGKNITIDMGWGARPATKITASTIRLIVTNLTKHIPSWYLVAVDTSSVGIGRRIPQKNDIIVKEED